jgi:ribosomal protein S27AE
MATATLAVSNPAVSHKFATGRYINIKIVAVVCECGAISHGKGVRKAKVCQRCGAFIYHHKRPALSRTFSVPLRGPGNL